MNEIENQFKNIVNRYELFTGSRDQRNQHLYSQLDINLLKQKSITMKYLLCIWKKVLIKEILINNNWLSFFLNMVK